MRPKLQTLDYSEDAFPIPLEGRCISRAVGPHEPPPSRRGVLNEFPEDVAERCNLPHSGKWKVS
jgi:hypothetical protein